MKLYAVEIQPWRRWPKKLVMRETVLDGADVTVRFRSYSPEGSAEIKTETEDGITGRAWCSRCGNSVHRASRFCQHCGARFEPRR